VDEETDNEEGNEICVAKWVEKPGDKHIVSGTTLILIPLMSAIIFGDRYNR
jgi:hypothetical protein